VITAKMFQIEYAKYLSGLEMTADLSDEKRSTEFRFGMNFSFSIPETEPVQ
jgi:hypothetical protein